MRKWSHRATVPSLPRFRWLINSMAGLQTFPGNPEPIPSRLCLTAFLTTECLPFISDSNPLGEFLLPQTCIPCQFLLKAGGSEEAVCLRSHGWLGKDPGMSDLEGLLSACAPQPSSEGYWILNNNLLNSCKTSTGSLDPPSWLSFWLPKEHNCSLLYGKTLSSQSMLIQDGIHTTYQQFFRKVGPAEVLRWNSKPLDPSWILGEGEKIFFLNLLVTKWFTSSSIPESNDNQLRWITFEWRTVQGMVIIIIQVRLKTAGDLSKQDRYHPKRLSLSSCKGVCLGNFTKFPTCEWEWRTPR